MKKNTRVVIAVAGVAAIAAGTAVAVVRGRHMDDPTLRAALVGAWRAVDPENGTFHHQKGGVASEEIVFRSDGTLDYRVTGKTGQGESRTDPYTWEVVKGKLQLRDAGPGSAHDALPMIRIAVHGTRLSVRRKGFAKKEFERVAAADGTRS